MVRASPYVRMKLQELKRRVKQSWTTLNIWKDGVVLQPENFDKDTKRFGDRRYKKTWAKALAYFEAVNAYEGCLDAYMLILHDFNFTADRWDYEYRHEILDAFLMYPDGLEIIKQGLEQLFSADFAPNERDEAHGFFEMVEEREGERRTIGVPDGPAWRLPATATAA